MAKAGRPNVWLKTCEFLFYRARDYAIRNRDIPKSGYLPKLCTLNEGIYLNKGMYLSVCTLNECMYLIEGVYLIEGMYLNEGMYLSVCTLNECMYPIWVCVPYLSVCTLFECMYLIEGMYLYEGIYLNECMYLLRYVNTPKYFSYKHYGINLRTLTEGEISLYGWPPIFLFGFSCFAYEEWIILLVWSNPNQSYRRLVVQWYFPSSRNWATFYSDIWSHWLSR